MKSKLLWEFYDLSFGSIINNFFIRRIGLRCMYFADDVVLDGESRE